MTPVGSPSRRRFGAAPLAGLAVLGLLSLLGRWAAPVLAVAHSPGGPGGGDSAGDLPRRQGDPVPDAEQRRRGDAAPGEPRTDGTDIGSGVRGYLIGLGLAALLTAGSFALSYTHLVYGPGLPVALIVLAVAQVGIHLVFFLHLTTSPDNVNNALALAFGILILLLVIGGTLWIMGHMNANMMPIGGHRMAPGQMMNIDVDPGFRFRG